MHPFKGRGQGRIDLESRGYVVWQTGSFGSGSFGGRTLPFWLCSRSASSLAGFVFPAALSRLVVSSHYGSLLCAPLAERPRTLLRLRAHGIMDLRLRGFSRVTY